MWNAKFLAFQFCDLSKILKYLISLNTRSIKWPCHVLWVDFYKKEVKLKVFIIFSQCFPCRLIRPALRSPLAAHGGWKFVWQNKAAALGFPSFCPAGDASTQSHWQEKSYSWCSGSCAQKQNYFIVNKIYVVMCIYITVYKHWHASCPEEMKEGK